MRLFISKNILRTDNIAYLFIIMGILSRLVLACLTASTYDVDSWFLFGKSINSHGLAWTYAQYPLFNHPPISAYLISLIVYLSKTDPLVFGIFFKILGAFADILIGVLVFYALKKMTGDKALALKAWSYYSLSLCPILISSAHGNTDSICLLFAFLSIILLEFTNLYIISGLLFALALNIKLIPILLLPGILTRITSLGKLISYSQGLVVGLLPLLIAIVYVGDDFIKNVLNYTPVVTFLWGLIIFSLAFDLSESSIMKMVSLTRPIVVFVIISISIVSRYLCNLGFIAISCLSFAVFTAYSPVFAIQYTIYLAPFIMCVSPKLGCIYTGLVGLMLANMYFSIGELLLFADKTSSHLFLSLISWSFTASLPFYIWKKSKRKVEHELQQG